MEQISPKVSFHTLGCRLNFSETGSIAQGFRDRGFDIVDFGNPADVVFINTCTVTDKADSTCRNLIRKAHRSSPSGKIVVAGCYAQMEPEEIAGMQGVDLVLGTHEKYKVFDFLAEDEAEKIRVDKSNEFWGAHTSAADSHTRAFLKIQDGCNYICSFCIIPFARGRSRTITVKSAVESAQKILNDGYKEIVLTGVNIGEYESTGGEKLTDLVRKIAELPKLERLRLSSVEPNTITDDLLDLMASSSKFMHHFHIPMQSGDDEILKKMKRKYDVSFYRKQILKIKERFPKAGIGADIIVGFPGETAEQFQHTFDLLKELPITHFHVFPYSKRKNTVAEKFENHIPHDEKKRRVKLLIELGEIKYRKFCESQVGKTSQVLFERRNEAGFYEGYTENFIKVELDDSADFKNTIHKVLLKETGLDRVSAELVQ
jgi:threonylcarbamoyladenosine tRNA methylthiotransferase MtaB